MNALDMTFPSSVSDRPNAQRGREGDTERGRYPIELLAPSPTLPIPHSNRLRSDARPMSALLTLVIVAFPLWPAQAAEPPQSDEKDEKAAQQRLAFLERLFTEFEVAAEDGRPLTGTEKPVLRYSNPVRNFFSDGATFLWLDGKRPAAAGTLSIRGVGKVWWEFTSFSGEPLQCRRNDRAVWSPASGNLVRRPLPNAPAPASASRLRLIQMRKLARRFTVVMQESAKEPDETKSLRLLGQPIYRWSDEKAGIVDGAVFSFSETTDPEALLMLELLRPEEKAELIWRYSVARMTSRPLHVRFNDREVCFLKGYWANPRSPRDPYAAGYLGMYEPPDGDGQATLSRRQPGRR